MKDLKTQPNLDYIESAKETRTSIRGFKIDDLDISFKSFFNIFRIIFTAVGFGDDFNTHDNILKKISVAGGKIFLLFSSVLHLLIVLSSLFIDRNIDTFWKVNEFILTASSLLQTFLWYKNRKYFRKSIETVWKNYHKIRIQKDRKELQIFVSVGFIIDSLLFIIICISTYKSFHVDLSYIDSCFFELIVDDKTARSFLSFIVALSWVWIPLKNSFFVWYYTFLCKVLHNIIKESIAIMDKEDISTFLNMYKNVIDDVSLVENNFSGLLGLVCWVCLYEIFALQYMIIYEKNGILHRYMIIIWYAVMLLWFLVSASLVNESLDHVKYCINQRNLFDASNQSIRFVLKACFMNVKLTIWKIHAMNRTTIFSILGTFLTYSYLIIPEKCT